MRKVLRLYKNKGIKITLTDFDTILKELDKEINKDTN